MNVVLFLTSKLSLSEWRKSDECMNEYTHLNIPQDISGIRVTVRLLTNAGNIVVFISYTLKERKYLEK